MTLNALELEAKIAELDTQLAALSQEPETAVDKRIGAYSEANSQKYRMLSDLRNSYLDQLRKIPYEEVDHFAM
ncbi:MAG TPA: hypothetical protein PKH07_04375 [bacterium]|nr:hypothetical protein [bacterium]